MSERIPFPEEVCGGLTRDEVLDLAGALREVFVLAEWVERDDARRIAHKPQGVVATILPVRRDLAPSSPDTSAGKSLPGGGRQEEEGG